MAAPGVGGPDRGRQPVGDGVGAGQHLGLVGEGLDGDDRAEDLLAGALRAVRYVDQHRRRDEVAVAVEGPAADSRADPLRLGAPEVAGHPVEVGLRDQRPDLDVLTDRGLADDQRGDLVDEERGEPFRHRLVDQHAAGCPALLARVPVAGGAHRRCRGRQVRVREDDHRGLAAQLQVDALERVGRGAGHRPAASDRTGERDHGSPFQGRSTRSERCGLDVVARRRALRFAASDATDRRSDI